MLLSVARLDAVVALLRLFAARAWKRAKNALSAREAAYLYRGVHAGHPAMAAALHGLVVPGRLNGAVTAEEHNLGGLVQDSPFTSWTRRFEVA